jgi:uncharacterized protein
MDRWINADDETLRGLLQAARTIAVVGLSNDRYRPSYGVAKYLQSQGYRIIPVNPSIDEALGERAYPDLLSVPESIDIVDIFRRSEYVGPHVDEAIQRGDARLIWMQVGVWNSAAARRAREAGLAVVMSRCLMVDHRRLMS